MLWLRRLEVSGFGPFANPAVLEFPDQQGVTVVYGDNMRGKTSLMNAIRFAFFGVVPGRGDTARALLSACNRDLVAEGRYGFSVGLLLRHEGVELDLRRRVTSKVAEPRADGELDTTISLRRGGVVLGPTERAAVLRSMLPEEVARFFLFDGELLDQYAELLISESEAGRIISEAIEQILGVPVLQGARNHLGVLASKASRASADEASKHRKTEALGNSLQMANDVKEAHEQERARKAVELRALWTEREAIETELRHQEAYAMAVERLDSARSARRKALATQEEKAAQLRVAMGDAWRTVLDEAVAKAKADAQEAMRTAFESLAMSLRVAAIEKRLCPTCDQELSEETRARLRATLKAELDGADSGVHDGIALLVRNSELEGFERKDVRAEVELIWDALRQARLDEVEAQNVIEDANRALEDHDPNEIRERKTTLKELAGKIQSARDAIGAEQECVEEQKASIARLAKQLAAVGSPELAAFQQRERVLNRSQAVFKDAVERFKAALRRRVEQSATGLFLEMTTEKEDYASLEINDHYGLTIIHRDGRAEQGRSAGAEQVVALALMGALQANAPLRGPIVMDTPFGRLDPQHTGNVVSVLPSMAEQVVLFVQEGEIGRDSVRKMLDGHLRKEYELERKTARQTVVKEVR